MNSLDDLVREYMRSVTLMSDMIEHGNELLRQARAKKDRSRIAQLRARQQDLYAQRAHLRETAYYLEHYYRHDPPTRIQ